MHVTGKASVNGAQLYFECAGAGPPLAFIPQPGADRRMWHDQVAAFARHYQVVRYDLRGWGRSPRRMGVYHHAQDVGALLDWLGIGRVALVGYKRGATIALDLALDRPEQVGALVLVEPMLSGWRPPAHAEVFDAHLQRLIAAAGEPNPAKRLVRFMTTAKALGRGFTPNAQPHRRIWRRRWAHLREHAILLANLPRTLAMLLGGPFTDWRNLRIAFPEDLDPEAASYTARQREPRAIACLEQVAVPTLIVRGVPTSPILMELDDELRLGIARAEMALMADAPGLPHLLQPKAFNRIVLNFLQRVYPSG